MNFKYVCAAIAAFLMINTNTVIADHGYDGMDTTKAVAVVGVINAVDVENHKINISHEPVKAIGWPAMKMDFKVMKGIGLKHVKAGEKVDFKITKGKDGIFMVVDLHHKH